MAENPKVFISYSHQDKAYEQKVLEFSNRLRNEGIDASIDLYEEAPKEGWPRWMENQIRWADFVVVLASKSYLEKCYSSGQGKGVHWEVNIVYQMLYDDNCETTKFIPAFFDERDADYILIPLKPFTHYNISNDEQFDKLYWRLRGISQYKKPELGKLRPLEPKEQKTCMYITTPIDLEKWNAARWKGMLYCLSPVGGVPVLGLLFENYDAAVSIFEEWRKNWGTGYVDDNLVINYVISPFPPDCSVYKDSERNFGKGYFVYIGPNIDESIKRAINNGLSPEELLLTSISRNIWVDEQNGTNFREIFTNTVTQIHDYQVIPAALIDKNKPLSNENIRLGFDYAIKMKNFSAKIGRDLDSNDVVKSVFKEAYEL